MDEATVDDRAGEDRVGERPADTPARRRWITITLAVVAALGVLAWWAWPALTGESDELDVLVVADGFEPEARRPIEIRVRELGRSISWLRAGADRCESAARVASAVAARSPDVVILTAPPGGDCLTDAVAGIDGIERVAVVPAGTAAAADTSIAGFHLVDPIALVGAEGVAVSLPCQWWETCPPDGQVAVRDVAGVLTDLGIERLARAVAADL